jgi:Protein of unknown function (DUF1488)
MSFGVKTTVGPQHFQFDGEYIHFHLEEEGASVACSVKAEYLAKRAAKDGITDQSYRALFVLYRGAIEALASDKYHRGISHPIISMMDYEWSNLMLKTGHAF